MMSELGDGRSQGGNHGAPLTLREEVEFVVVERRDLVRDHEGQIQRLAVVVHSHVQATKHLRSVDIVLIFTPLKSNARETSPRERGTRLSR